jgi:RecB family exonuclease
VRILENTFSWSVSRGATFRRCLREYWWQYYGSWGGWETTCAPETRQAYMLKKLATRWAWVGTVVHGVIERVLQRIHERTVGGEGGQLEFGGADLDVEREVEQATRLMRRQFRESRAGRYRERPSRHFGLAEHEYGEDVPGEEWRQLHGKAVGAVRRFLASELFARLRSSDPATWFPIEARAQFAVGGIPVWAAPDFARRTPDGGAEIYDWKTGMASESNRLQLACYTLYMHRVHGIDPTRVQNHLVYLGGADVEVQRFGLTQQDLLEAEREILGSVEEMRARLADAEANRAEREDFPLTEDRGKCAACVFRRLCER